MIINLRSPYFVYANDTNLEILTLELFVYSGTKNTDRTPAIYTLTTSNEFVFEISELAKEYLYILFEGNYNSQTVWVDYRLTKTISGVITVGDYVNLEGYYGYNYFEDGSNPQTNIDVLQSDLKYYTPENQQYFIPVKTENLTKIDFYFVNGAIETELFNIDQNESENLIKYISVTSSAELDYEFQDGNLYLFQDGNQFSFKTVQVISNSGLKKMVLYFTTGNKTINITTVKECKYKTYKIIFVNKYGAFQNLWMFGNSILNLSTKDNKYKNATYNNYSTSAHDNKILNKQGNQKITFNTGFYPESHNNIFQELLLSDLVWLEYENNILPINIDNSTFNFKDRLYDKLINYNIDASFSFDAINKLR